MPNWRANLQQASLGFPETSVSFAMSAFKSVGIPGRDSFKCFRAFMYALAVSLAGPDHRKTRRFLDWLTSPMSDDGLKSRLHSPFYLYMAAKWKCISPRMRNLSRELGGAP